MPKYMYVSTIYDYA